MLKKLIFNWLVILSSPIWILPVFIFAMVAGLTGKTRFKDASRIATGKDWIA